MTLSGKRFQESNMQGCVLIPLLVDDPLRALFTLLLHFYKNVLIPLLVDDPLREFLCQ